MRKTVAALFIMLGCSGCVILGNLDEVFTLQGYSNNKDEQHQFVKETNDHYDALSKTIDSGHINDYKDEISFVKLFGDPLIKKNLNNGEQRWLYRHAIFRLSKDKIYLYFNAQGQLIKWEKLPCSLSF